MYWFARIGYARRAILSSLYAVRLRTLSECTWTRTLRAFAQGNLVRLNCIESAALAVIERSGLADFSILHARRPALGCTAMSLYHYFPSKGHLMDALVAPGGGGATAAAAGPASPWRDHASPARRHSPGGGWRCASQACFRFLPTFRMNRRSPAVLER